MMDADGAGRTEDHRAAAIAIAAADAVLITAGAGMGVDSGMPDFRGNLGFWRAYPAFAEAKLRFEKLATPRWFKRDPALAWGFYGSRAALYKSLKPHAGFELLRKWSAQKRLGTFVFTSNVDGHFQRAGFSPSRVVECHGTLSMLQCAVECGRVPWPMRTNAVINPVTLHAVARLPSCPDCGNIARPNVLMFEDWSWNDARTEKQQARLDAWMARVRSTKARLVVVEIGAGTSVSTVRATGESTATITGATLVRINPVEHMVPPGHVGVRDTALLGLSRIDAALREIEASG